MKTIKVKVDARHNTCGSCDWLIREEPGTIVLRCTLFEKYLYRHRNGQSAKRCIECTGGEIGRTKYGYWHLLKDGSCVKMVWNVKKNKFVRKKPLKTWKLPK